MKIKAVPVDQMASMKEKAGSDSLFLKDQILMNV